MVSGNIGARPRVQSVRRYTPRRCTVRQLVRFGFLIAIIALAAVPAFGQTNPFLDRPPQESAPSEDGPPVMDHSPAGSFRWGGGPLGRIWASVRSVLVSWQRGLNRSLGLRLRSLSTEDPGLFALIGALGFAFAFGFLHAVLPGHRKSVLISYCIADNARIVHGIALGFLFSVMHAVSAVVIVMVTMSLLEVAIGSTIAQVSRITQIVSSVLLIGIGIVFCYMTGREIRNHHNEHDHHGHGAHVAKPTDLRMRRWVPVVLSTGIIPCPITTALMLFAVSINAVALGVAAVIALSAGLGLALAVLAILTIVIKDRVLVLFEHKAGHMLHAGVELAGGVMILAVGLFTLALLV